MGQGVAQINAFVGLLERNNPRALAALRTRFPDFEMQSGRSLGEPEQDINNEAVLALAFSAVDSAGALASRVQDYIQRRIRIFGRLTLLANMVSAGSSVGLVAAIGAKLHNLELIAAGTAFTGSLISLLSQYIENSGNGGASIKDALARLVSLSAALAEAKGALEMFRAMPTSNVNLEDVIRRAHSASAELLGLQISLGVRLNH